MNHLNELKMKKLSYLLLMSLLPAFIMTGCDKDNEGNDEQQIVMLDKSEENQTGYADDETTGGFTFTAKSNWEANVVETPASRASSVPWLRLLLNGTETYNGGAGTFTLTIEMDPNYTGETRSAMITIASGTDKISITVTQEGTTKEGKSPDPDPASDHSDMIIAALNRTADSHTLTVRMKETYTSEWPHYEDGTTETCLAYNPVSRKCLEYRKTTDNNTSVVTTDHIKYLEGDHVYYKRADNTDGAKKYHSGTDLATFWGKFNHKGLISYLEHICGLPPRDWNQYLWTVNGNEYTATFVANYGNINEEIKISLDGNRISRIWVKTLNVTNVINAIERTKEIVVEYTASPELPAGFSKEDFIDAQQYSLRVVWGNGLGESTFYTDLQSYNIGYIGWYNSNTGIAPETILYYTPEQTGKKAEYYSDAGFTQPVEMSKPIYITGNDAVIYVKWVAI
jgi:hypothetical protein